MIREETYETRKAIFRKEVAARKKSISRTPKKEHAVVSTSAAALRKYETLNDDLIF